MDRNRPRSRKRFGRTLADLGHAVLKVVVASTSTRRQRLNALMVFALITLPPWSLGTLALAKFLSKFLS